MRNPKHNRPNYWKRKVDEPKPMGLRSLYQQSVLRPEWANRSTEIKKRDNYTCQKCNKNGVVLHVHHKYYVNGRLPWEYPDQTLVTLCNDCHSEEHENKIPIYNEKEYNLIQMEAPHIHERELMRRRNEELKRKELRKRNEKLEHENRKENERLRKEKRAKRKETIITILLIPIYLIIALLFIGRVLGARLVGSSVISGITFWLLNDQSFPVLLALTAAVAMGILAYMVLDKFVSKRL